MDAKTETAPMDGVTTLLTRKSIPPPALTSPGPTPAQVETMFAAGHRAADHGRLRPWRFFVIDKDARSRFVDEWLAALERMAPDTPPEKLAAKRKAYSQPPVAIAVAACVEEIPKVPATEQIIAAGGATQNVLNAAHALGFGAMLLSGKAVLDERLKRSFGLGPGDWLIGVIFVGTPKVRPQPAAVDIDERVSVWRGAG